jgi:glycosyltransferase involved in cell wall biosynthesis
MKYMRSIGHEVTVVTTTSPHRIYDSTILGGVQVDRRPVLARIRGPRVTVPVYTPGAPILREIIRAKFDLIHSFTFLTYSSILGAFGIRARKILRTEVGPPVSLVNGYPTIFGRIRSSGALVPLVRVYSKVFDKLTVYTPTEARSLRILGVPEKKISLLPPMVDYESYNQIESVEHGIPTFGCLARIHHIKGIDRIIAPIRSLLEQNLEFRFVLGGRIEQDGYGHQILNALKEVLGHRLILMGELQSPLAFYKEVDAAIVPSRYETGAISVLESLASGRTTIASDIHPINEYIANGVNGFLFSNELQLYDIMKEFILRGSPRGMVESARQTAKNFDYKHVLAEQYLEMLA